MDMSNFRPDQLHVALQRRRDKLRYQQNAIEQQQLDAYTDNLEQLSAHQGLDRDFVQLQSCKYGNISYEPTPFTVSQALLAHKDGMVVHRGSATNHSDKAVAHEDDASFTNLSQAISSSSFNFPAKVSGDHDPQNCSTWKSIGSQQHCDWIANYTSGSAGVEGNTSQIYVGEAGLSGAGAMKIINSSPSTVDVKPSYFGYHEVQSSMNNPSSEISSQNVLKHYGNMQFDTHSLHQNTLQDVVTSATLGNREVKMVPFAHQNTKETGRGPWMDAGNELVLLPTYADQSSRVHLNCSSDLVNRPVEGCHRLIGGSNYPADKNFERGFRAIPTDSSSVQALSLSLSSVPQSKMRVDQEAERNISEHVRSSSGCITHIPDSKAFKSNYAISNPRSSIGGKLSINSCQDMVGTSSFNHRNVGPLGPFTGYATILRSSKFLRPAQQLLDEFCNVANPKPGRSCEALQGDHRVSSDAVKADELASGATGGDSGGSSSTFYSSNEKSQEAAVLSCSNESIRPEYLQKKAKLLYMQEEICRRYKQYHQQMQMVVSSFESVAGLRAATPFISLALKTISRHFRCLKNAIFSQLRNVGKTIGEDSSCPTKCPGNGKVDASTSRVKFIDQTFHKQKAGVGSVGTFQPQQHVWRPQRGLPERAVAVLRAWLFDHFLHPYPTDADKHMLATQTGLTRNQVSNWFINARVRVWKPMVEEIHTLEAKGLAESGTNAARTDNEKPCSESVQGLNDSQQLNKLTSVGVPNAQINGTEMGSSTSAQDNRSNPDMWNLEKRSRVDCRHPASMDGSLMDFMPYEGLGAVSLTLGLRQSVESGQQQQQLQLPERPFMQHFGDQAIHDFVG